MNDARASFSLLLAGGAAVLAAIFLASMAWFVATTDFPINVAIIAFARSWWLFGMTYASYVFALIVYRLIITRGKEWR